MRHGARVAQPAGTRLVYRPIAFGVLMNSAAPSGETPGPGQEEPAGEATVPRMLLGAQLRRLREAADITAEKAGYEIRASRSKIGRIETGRVGLKLRDIEDLPTLYGVATNGSGRRSLPWPGGHASRSGRNITTSCRTWSTSSSSPAPSTWTSARTWSTTSRSPTSSAARR